MKSGKNAKNFRKTRNSFEDSNFIFDVILYVNLGEKLKDLECGSGQGTSEICLCLILNFIRDTPVISKSCTPRRTTDETDSYSTIYMFGNFIVLKE